MRRRAVLLALLLAVTVPVAVRAATFACSPLCAVFNDPWDPLYWIFGCDQCPPNPPDAG